MITWMQTHRKWLVITMWISVISFVGAGAVGWGSYDYNKSTKLVATVGDKEITYKDMQTEYNKIYNYYASMFGGQFNQEMAKNFGLEKQAYSNLIQQFLLINFADEVGLIVTDEEIVKEIISVKEFMVNNQFDKKTYLKLLKDNQIKIKDFESDIKRSLLLRKVSKLLNIPLTNTEKRLLSATLNIKDKISLDILDISSVVVDKSDKAIKEYWSKNRSKYLTQKQYHIEAVEVSMLSEKFDNNKIEQYYKENITRFNNKKLSDVQDDIINSLNEKATKKSANKLFYSLKKGEVSNSKKINFNSTDLDYGFLATFLDKEIKGKTLKPLKTQNGFIIVKLIDIDTSKEKDYVDAKVDASIDYISEAQKKNLEELAKSRLMMFNGKDMGFVSINTQTIGSLNSSETQQFLKKLFESKVESGYVLLNNKAVLYKIDNSILESDINSSKILNIKADIVNSTLIKYLKTKYSVSNYYNKEG